MEVSDKFNIVSSVFGGADTEIKTSFDPDKVNGLERQSPTFG